MVQAMRQEEVREREEAKKRRQAQQVGTVIASMSCFEGAGNVYWHNAGAGGMGTSHASQDRSGGSATLALHGMAELRLSQ